LAQALKSLDGVDPKWFGFAGLLFLPFNFRVLFAACYDRFSVRPSTGLRTLLVCSGACVLVSGIFPVSALRSDAQETKANLGVVYLLFGLVLLFTAAGDPLLDALLFSARTLPNSVQSTAWKIGKAAGGLTVSILLRRVGWQVAMATLGLAYAVGAVFVPREPGPGKPSRPSLSWRELIVRSSGVLSGPKLRWLVFLGLTNKLAESVLKRAWVPLFVDCLRASAAAETDVDTLIASMVTREGDEAAFLAVLGSVLTALFCRGRERSWFKAVCVWRVACLVALACLLVAERPCSDDSNDSDDSVDLVWKWVKVMYELQSGASAVLFALLCFSELRANADVSQGLFMTVYAVFESCDSWAKAVGTVVAGFALERLDTHNVVWLCVLLACLPCLPWFASYKRHAKSS
jgi:hypothetical protein